MSLLHLADLDWHLDIFEFVKIFLSINTIIFSFSEMFLMRCLPFILLILMHFVEEKNIWIFLCIFIFWKIILNHGNVLLASLLHPADLDALFWKTLKNVEHMPYLIFVCWGLNFFSWLRFLYERYQQIISTCGADVKYQVWQMPNVLHLCYCYVQVLPTSKKCHFQVQLKIFVKFITLKQYRFGWFWCCSKHKKAF